MFYSHQLLARKAPLGQIWMAATLHAKMNRRKLDQLNIIKVCEQILYPSVPMALRLSGILMGGVVIVYERKVKLLLDDVTRLLVELNEAWKVKAAPSDPTRLPKNKYQAKRESITLPGNHDEDLEEIEHSRNYSDAATVMGFQQTSYISMRLDTVDDSYTNPNTQGVPNHNHHQADAADITLCENYDSFQMDTNTFNRFERFDIEGDADTHMDFTPPEHIEIPRSTVPSPPPQEEPHKSDDIQEEHLVSQVRQQSRQQSNEANQGQMKKRYAQRKGKRPTALVMDNNQNIIPGHIYQTWLQDTSDITSRRGKKGKMRPSLPTMKLSTLMDLPSIVLFEKLVTNGNRQIHYPTSLLETWMKITQPPHDSPSARTSPPHPPEPSSSSPPERTHFMEPLQEPFEDYQSRKDSQLRGVSIEKQRANVNENDPPEIIMEELRSNLMNHEQLINEAFGVNAFKDNIMTTPGNSGDDIRSIPSSGSGQGFLSNNSEANSGRSSKKRAFPASKNSGNGLEPVAEEFPWQHLDPNFKLARVSENGFTPDDDLMVETGPTQTQKFPTVNQPLDHITDSIRMHLKTHFDTPGSAKVESLKGLAFGMNRKRAASLFYQTCVLATRDMVKVEQREPYGDILISRGAKM